MMSVSKYVELSLIDVAHDYIIVIRSESEAFCREKEKVT